MAGVVAALMHGVQDAAVDGFQAVPHIGQGALHNDTHGIVDIGFLHFLFDVDRNDFASCDGLTSFC